MTASDTIEAAAACPHCGDIYYLECETQFFEPDDRARRTLRPGVTYPLSGRPRPREGWRRRPGATVDGRFTVLVDCEHVVHCACGCPCAPLLHFVHAGEALMLERVELLDVRGDIAERVDFAQIDGGELAQALAATVAAKPDLGQWTALAGPTRCGACGDARERLHYTLLAHPRASVGQLFGREWQGRAIMIGDRVPSNARPREAAIAILGDIGSWGCSCGAGPARYVARFEREGDELVLVDLALGTADDI